MSYPLSYVLSPTSYPILSYLLSPILRPILSPIPYLLSYPILSPLCNGASFYPMTDRFLKPRLSPPNPTISYLFSSHKGGEEVFYLGFTIGFTRRRKGGALFWFGPGPGDRGEVLTFLLTPILSLSPYPYPPILIPLSYPFAYPYPLFYYLPNLSPYPPISLSHPITLVPFLRACCLPSLSFLGGSASQSLLSFFLDVLVARLLLLPCFLLQG